jgi:hypothetical protein
MIPETVCNDIARPRVALSGWPVFGHKLSIASACIRSVSRRKAHSRLSARTACSASRRAFIGRLFAGASSSRKIRTSWEKV